MGVCSIDVIGLNLGQDPAMVLVVELKNSRASSLSHDLKYLFWDGSTEIGLIRLLKR